MRESGHGQEKLPTEHTDDTEFRNLFCVFGVFRGLKKDQRPRPSRRRGPATGRLLASASRPEPPTPPLGSKHNRICGADLPSSLETGLFNRRPAPRYGEEERSELGSFFI